MALIIRKTPPVKQDQREWVRILTADPTRPLPSINFLSAVTVTIFVLLALITLSVVVFQQFLINHQPPQYTGLSSFAFTAVALLLVAALAVAALSVLRTLSPYLYSMIYGLTVAVLGILTVLFIFFASWELVLWLVSPSNLPSSLQIADTIYKLIFH